MLVNDGTKASCEFFMSERKGKLNKRSWSKSLLRTRLVRSKDIEVKRKADFVFSLRSNRYVEITGKT